MSPEQGHANKLQPLDTQYHYVLFQITRASLIFLYYVSQFLRSWLFFQLFSSER